MSTERELERALEAGRVVRLEQEEMPDWAKPDHLDQDEYQEEIALFSHLFQDTLRARGMEEDYEIRDVSGRAPSRPTSPLHISEDVLVVPAGAEDHDYAAAINVDYGNVWLRLGAETYLFRTPVTEHGQTASHAYAEGLEDAPPLVEREGLVSEHPEEADDIEYTASDGQVELYGVFAEFLPVWAAASDNVVQPWKDYEEMERGESSRQADITDILVSGPNTGRFMRQHLKAHYDRYVDTA